MDINTTSSKISKKIRPRKEFQSFFISSKRDSNLSTTSILQFSKISDKKKLPIHRFSTEIQESEQIKEDLTPGLIAFQKFKSVFLKKKLETKSQLLNRELEQPSSPLINIKSGISRDVSSNYIIQEPQTSQKLGLEELKCSSLKNLLNFPPIRAFDDEKKAGKHILQQSPKARKFKKKASSIENHTDSDEETDIKDIISASNENNERVERILILIHKLVNHYKGIEVSKVALDLEGCFAEILTLTSQLRLPMFQLKTLECYGKVLLLVGNYRRALRIFKNHRNLSILINDSKEKLTSYFFIALTYSMINEYDRSLIFLKKMLKVSWKTNDSNNELKCYDFIGLVFYKMGFTEKSSFFHELMIRGECIEKEAWFRRLAEESIDIKRRLKLNNYLSQIIFEEFSYTHLTKDSQAVQSILTDSEDDFDLDMFMRENKYRLERQAHSNVEDHANKLSERKKYTKSENLMRIHIQRKRGKSTLEAQTLGPSVNRSFNFLKQAPQVDTYNNQGPKGQSMINHLSGNRNLSTYLISTYYNPLAYDFFEHINKEFDSKDKKKLVSYLMSLKKIVERYIEYLSEKLGIAVPLTVKLGRKKGRLYSNVKAFGFISPQKAI